MKAGMNVARLNFSHGTYADHGKLIKNIRRASRETGQLVSILQDLSGPKLRVGDLGEKGMMLKKGATVHVTSDPKRKDALVVTYARLEKDVKVGEHILLDDGLLELEVVAKNAHSLSAKVLFGGLLKSHKGFNLPGSKLSISSITEKDKKDLQFGLKNEVDFVALSFVRSARDVKELHGLIKKHWNKKNGAAPKVITKVEKAEALVDLVAIIKETDGIMVARGDLGVETPATDVPIHQKNMIALCREAGKPVIVATEMLGSMVSRPRPTRAEVSDVANAVIDHTDAVMLSGESASGDFPVEAVAMMGAIARETEASVLDDVEVCALPDTSKKTSRGAGVLAGILAERGDVQAILVTPDSLDFLSQMAFFRPHVPVIAGAVNPRDARIGQLYWGTYFVTPVTGTPMFITHLKKSARHLGLAQSDVVVLITRRWHGYQMSVAPLRDLKA